MPLTTMAKEFQLSVVAPDRTVFEDNVESVVLPGVEGYLGVQAGHEATIVALRPGIIEFKDNGGQRYFVSTSGGFSEIGGDKVIVLAENAQRSTEIDVAEAEKKLEEARKALRGEASTMTTDEAVDELELAQVRLKAARLV
ncbi:MAG: ATP synthase F1 subunit epsilon [Armatimonadetes bacterium]|nr:ATP synthase F1 subunit epsilon [Armatimonadota bacterium]